MHMGSGVNVQGGSFALLLPWGMVLWFLSALPPYECFWCPYLRFMLFGADYCHYGIKIKIWAFYGFNYSSYSYRFRNWCGTAGFCGGGSFCKELYWCSFRNWIHF